MQKEIWWTAKNPPQILQSRALLTVTTPTSEILNHNYLLELIQKQSSYQVIPSIPKSMVCDPQGMLLRVLPHTKYSNLLDRNILLDIALPFVIVDPDKLQVQYFGRYIIFNERLIGVRLSCSKQNTSTYACGVSKWKHGICDEKYPVPSRIMKYYRMNLPPGSYKSQMFVGDFMLTLWNCRIALFFQSELQEDQQLFEEPGRYGCDILSIINDIPYDNRTTDLPFKNYKSGTFYQKRIQTYAEQHNRRIVMYAGCKILTPGQLYLANSLIYQNKIGRIEPPLYIFTHGGTLSLSCDLQACKDKSKLATNWRHGRNFQQNQHELVVSSHLRPVKLRCGEKIENPAFKSSISRQPKDQMEDVLGKLYIWYLFTLMNQGEPFVIPLPLTRRTRQFFRQISGITCYNQMQLKNLVKLYKTEYDVGETYGLQPYRDIAAIIQQDQLKKYFIYTDDIRQIRNLGRLAQLKQNIILCHFLLPKGNEAQSSQQPIFSDNQQKQEEFCDWILRMKDISIQRVIFEASSTHWNLSNYQLKNCFQKYLRKRLRAEAKQSALSYLLLKSSRQDLIDVIKQVEEDLKAKEVRLPHLTPRLKYQRSINASQMVPEEQERQPSQPKIQPFQFRLKQVRKTRDKQLSNVLHLCHCCKTLMDKAFVNNCRECSITVCFCCIEDLLPQKPQVKKDFNFCVVCQNICNCESCKQKKNGKNIDHAIEEKLPIIAEQLSQRNFDSYRDCSYCQIEGRKNLRIKISCIRCTNQYCLSCARTRYKKNINLKATWICYICEPPPPSPIRMIDQTQEVNGLGSSNLNKKGSKEIGKHQSPQFSPSPVRRRRQNSRSNSGSKSVERNKNRNDQQHKVRQERSFGNIEENTYNPIPSFKSSNSINNNNSNRNQSQNRNFQERQTNNFRGKNNNPRNNDSRFQDTRNDNYSGNHRSSKNIEQTQRKKSKSRSISNSPVRNKRRSPSDSKSAEKNTKKRDIEVKDKIPEGKKKRKSISRSISPPKRVRKPSQSPDQEPKKNGPQRKPSVSDQASPPKRKETQELKKHKKSKSPDSATPPRNKKRRSRSSASASPKKEKKKENKKKSVSSQSKSPPRKARKRSSSHSRSKQRSRSRDRNKGNQDGQVRDLKPLWGDKHQNQNQGNNRPWQNKKYDNKPYDNKNQERNYRPNNNNYSNDRRQGGSNFNNARGNNNSRDFRKDEGQKNNYQVVPLDNKNNSMQVEEIDY